MVAIKLNEKKNTKKVVNIFEGGKELVHIQRKSKWTYLDI